MPKKNDTKNRAIIKANARRGEVAAAVSASAKSIKVGGRSLAVVPLWPDILTEKNLEEMKGLFATGLDSTMVAARFGVEKMLFEIWIKWGRMVSRVYAVQAMHSSLDLTEEQATRALNDMKLPAKWLKHPPPKDGRYALAVMADMGCSELVEKAYERILKEGSPSDLINFMKSRKQ